MDLREKIRGGTRDLIRNLLELETQTRQIRDQLEKEGFHLDDLADKFEDMLDQAEDVKMMGIVLGTLETISEND